MSGYKKVVITMELIVEDTTKLDWIADCVYDQLYTGETLTEYKVETLQENVDPILENYMAE